MAKVSRDFDGVGNDRCSLIAETASWADSVLVSSAESA